MSKAAGDAPGHAWRRTTCKQPPGAPCYARNKRGACAHCHSFEAQSANMKRLNADPAFAAASAAGLRARRLTPDFVAAHRAAVGGAWGPEQDVLLSQLRADDTPVSACAQRLGCSPATVRKHMRRLGLALPGNAKSPAWRARHARALTIEWTAEMDRDLARLRSLGASIAECARYFELSESTIGKRLDRLRLPRRLPAGLVVEYRTLGGGATRLAEHAGPPLRGPDEH